ncbi:LysR family transcriptional regulator [Pantoea sp. A4]|uniref:LysR family transcriptional regulator n=1 Tax=Pantoea sp. A4 TaxID=1225184 RepID=UPI00036BE793|nr:LysR family transcriptional regulator [Pantoea sp. A4]
MHKAAFPNVRHIQLALIIIAGESLRSAARTCNMTQPAASLAINTLEEMFGVMLFERSPRGLQPTPYAEAVQIRGNRALLLLMQAMTTAYGKESSEAFLTHKLAGLTTSQLLAMAALRGARNFTAAASELGMKPPSLRRTLLALEGWLGFTLVMHDEIPLRLTEKGKKVGQLVALAVSELRAIKTEIDQMDSKSEGSVIIGSVWAAAAQLLPEVILTLNKHHPQGKFSVIRESYDVMLDALEAARIDYVCSVLRPAKLSSGLTAEVLVHTQLRALCAANHPLVGKQVQLADLVRYPWVGPPKETAAASSFRALFAGENITPPDFTIETYSTEWTHELVMGSDYLLLCRTTANSQHFPPAGMVYLQGLTFGESQSLWLIQRKDFRPTPFQSLFYQTLKTLCAEATRLSKFSPLTASR